MAPHSSTVAWKIPWTEEPGGLQSMESPSVSMTERLHFPFSLSCIGEGNGNPLQCSCLENPRDRGPWWAAIYGVTQSRTRLKRLSSSSSSSSRKVDTRPLSAVRKNRQRWEEQRRKIIPVVLIANLRCLPPQTLKAFSPKKMTKNSHCRKDLLRITGEISIWIIN